MNPREAAILRDRHQGAYSRAIPKETAMYFDGSTYRHARDSARLGDQMAAVFDLMKDGTWRTLEQIAVAVGAPEASVSSRLRDLRKERFGGHSVNRSYIARGIYMYQLVIRQAVVA